MSTPETHEVLGDWIGDIAHYAPSRDALSGMQADIDGEWLRDSEVEAAMIDEINRLRGLLSANGIDHGSEFICTCGIRREPKRDEPDF